MHKTYSLIQITNVIYNEFYNFGEFFRPTHQKAKKKSRPNPTQPNPWVDLTHGELCLLYVQLMYHNAMSYNQYKVMVNRTRDRGNTRVIATCQNSLAYFDRSASASDAHANYKFKSCYTGAIAHLAAEDTVSIRSRRGCLVSARSTDTFIGFIKLSAD